MVKIHIITILLLYFCWTSNFNSANAKDHQQILTISPQIALPVGIKIWFNECNGSVMGLTTWNDGENFASLGIGHFIWHPYPSKQASTNSGFPALLKYIREQGIALPIWLSGQQALYCPWKSRDEFLYAQHSRQMAELRHFLQKTIPLQAEYMTRNLQKMLPDMLICAPPEDRLPIYKNFSILASTPIGIYALVDYLNFKGAGMSKSRWNYQHGSGLLQVLNGMRSAPKDLTPLQAYVWSAKKALIRRVNNSSSPYHQRWLAGWFKRLNTYLEKNSNTQAIIIN